jgi:hypothetical protein
MLAEPPPASCLAAFSLDFTAYFVTIATVIGLPDHRFVPLLRLVFESSDPVSVSQAQASWACL